MRGSRGRSFCSIAPARRRAWDSAADIDPRTSSLTIADQSRIRRKAGISPQNDPGADLSLFRMIALNHVPPEGCLALKTRSFVWGVAGETPRDPLTP